MNKKKSALSEEKDLQDIIKIVKPLNSSQKQDIITVIDVIKNTMVLLSE